MKRIFTIITIALISSSAFAQNDLTVTFTNITAGTLQPAGPFDATVTITNNGTATYPFTYVVGYQYLIDNMVNPGVIYNQALSNFLSSPFAPGDSFTLTRTPDLSSSPVAGTPEVCVIVYGINTDINAMAALQTITNDGTTYPTSAWDGNFTDNYVCVTNTVVGTTSVADLNEVTNKLYYANNQIIFDWTNMNEDNSAEISILNLQGQVIESNKINVYKGRNTLNLKNHISKGLYLVSFKMHGNVSTTKILVN